MKTRTTFVLWTAIAGASATRVQAQASPRPDVMRGVGSAIPVYVTMSRGSMRVVGSSGDSVSWEVRSMQGGSAIGRPILSGGWNRGLRTDDAIRIDVTPSAGPGPLELLVTVPRSLKLVNLRLASGDISIKALDGDVVVESDSGSVRGDQLGGGVIVETRDGGIDLSVNGTMPRRAVSLIAWNGTVSLGLPADGVASVDLPIPCGGVDHSPAADMQSWKAIADLGITIGQYNCQYSGGPDRGQQIFIGTWSAGGAAVRLQALRGTIVLRRR